MKGRVDVKGKEGKKDCDTEEREGKGKIRGESVRAMLSKGTR